MWEKIRSWFVRYKHVGISAVAILLSVSIILSMCHFIGVVKRQVDDVEAYQTQLEQNGDKVISPVYPEASEGGKQPTAPKTPEQDSLYAQVDEKDTAGNDSGNGQRPSGTNRSEFTVTFYTQDGSSMEPRTVRKGTPIASLPTPYKEGYIFVGWCYDAACTIPVAKDDVVAQDLSLYAAFSKEAALEPVHNVTFASAKDVDGTSFTITVIASDAAMTAEQVKAGICAKNLTNPDQENIFTVTGGDGTFVIHGRNPHGADVDLPTGTGFAAGATFRITLEDARLNFEGQPSTAREYNFTTAKEEVLNMALQQGMVFLPVEEVSNITNDGRHVDTLSIAVYQSDAEGKLSPTELTTGTFDYSGELKVGDVVCIYAGLDPNLRTLETPKEQNGDLGYVEITAKNGNRYTYKNASAEQVIFEPDMLPIPVAADMDTSDATVTVEDRYLDYSADVYANIELDSQTTVDVGDFIMFYSGTFGVLEGSDAAALTGYGKITGVTEGNEGTTVITYTVVGWNEVQSAMDVYNSERATGTELLENVDTAQLEAQISQQAIDSGFAEEAAMYLASLALATDNFTTLSENMNLEDYKVTLSDGTPISPEELQLMSSSIDVETEIDDGYPKVTIGVTPKHLGDISGTSADDRGLCIQLEISVTITMGKKGSDNAIEIKVSGVFVEELGVDFGMSSEAIWKVWGIFPYIAEYRATVNVDMLNYTGIEVNATMITKEKDGGDDEENDEDDEDDDEIKSIAEEIKGLLEEAQSDEDEEDGEDAYSNLTKRYSEMIQEESDWIKIVDKEIFSQEQRLPPALPIIAVEVKMDFVVKLDACISVGFDMEYLTGKRYTYTVDVFAGSIKNDVIILQEETFQFTFYALGRLAIKVGVELEFNIGLFSTDIASVGFAAGAGAYAKLWGYFYYDLKYTASTGWNQKYSGALLIEVGAYLELYLQAQAIGGTFSAECTLLDKEWPLWSVGRIDSIQDFTTAQEDMPNVEMQQYIRTRYLPDSVFDMTYLDLKDGEVKNKVYEDYFDSGKKVTEENRDNFDIRFTNNKFEYDPQTNALTVNPSSEDKVLEGEMIITWINYPLAFSSKPIQRTIPLYWSNLRDGYVIVPYTNGGSYVDIINCKYNAAVKVPEAPVRTGYVFDGWFADEELSIPYVFPELMPAEDADIYAKWTPATDTPYTVEHYQEQLQSGEYALVEAEQFTGTTDSLVMPETKSYTGYVTPAKQEVLVKADGSAVLRYYYALDWYTVTFDPGIVGGDSVSYDLKYGGKITAPVMAVKGYIFEGWDKTVVSAMGAENVTYTAQWSKDPNTSYRIEYYVQQLDGRYTMQYSLNQSGYPGTEFYAEQLRQLPVDGELTADQVILSEFGIEFENMTVGGVADYTAVVGANGKTVIKLNYKRLSNTVTLDYGYNDFVVTSKVFYGQEFTLPQTISRQGYTFQGWTQNGTDMVSGNVIPTADATYTALWTPNTYTVSFDSGMEDASGSMRSQRFTYGDAQALRTNEYTHDTWDFVGWATEPGGSAVYTDGQEVSNLTATADGEVTLYAVWSLHPFTITYENCEGAQNGNPTSYTIASKTIDLMSAVRPGYDFTGWLDENEEPITQIPGGSSGDLVITATWTPREDTPYTVYHKLETVTGDFTPALTELYVGTTDTAVIPEVKSYEGFTAPEAEELIISADGKASLSYHYIRNSYTITLDAAGGEVSAASVTAKYNAPVVLPTPIREGYGFEGWYTANGEKYTLSTMPIDGAELTAQWVAGQYGYTVNHYHQNVDGEGYTLAEAVSGTAEMDTAVTPEHKSYLGFTAPQTLQTLTIGADAGTNVVNYYYTRNLYKLTWDLAGGTADVYTQGAVYYGTPILAPDPVKPGYSYTWVDTPVTTMPAEDLAYGVTWTANNYEVVLNLNGGTVVSGSTDSRTVTYDGAYGQLPELVKEYYTFQGWYTDAEFIGEPVTAESPVNVADNHTLYAMFTPDPFSIHYHNMEDAENPNPGTYTIEDVVVLSAPAKRGYIFTGWYLDEALTEKATPIALGSTGEKSFYAGWELGSYDVVFHSNNGSDITVSQHFSTNETKNLLENTFTYEWYDFGGWTTVPGTEAMYTDGEQVTNLIGDGELHLYAVWTPHVFHIRYENMDGASHRNPENFQVGDRVVLLDADRTGYTFGGWFRNSDCTELIDETMIPAAPHDWIIYAKWTANPYSITFDSCLGKEVPTQTQLMEYDKPANLPLLSELDGFVKLGYSFQGWATSEGGSVVYTDGALANNVADSGNVTLYALWKLDENTITYDLGAGGKSHTNPESYTIEDNDIILKNPTAKSGYQFLGWYTESGTLVTQIVKGAMEDYTLHAKWAHGGIFTLSYTSSKSANYGTELTYTITRTLPAGTVAAKAPQHVYYRTLNGTAYGGTVSYSTENDISHFRHVGGPDVYATFEAADMKKTFTVQDWGAEAQADVAATYTIGSKSRYFYVELYDVVDTTGICQGSLGSDVRLTQTLSASRYQLSTSLYSWHSSQLVGSSAITITDSGFDSNDWRDVYPKTIMNEALTTMQEKYRDATATHYGFYTTFDLKENDDGYQWVKFTNATGRGGSTLAEYHFATKDGEEASSWGRNLSLPRYNTSASGDILFSGGDCSLSNSWSVVNTSTPYALISLNKNMSICFDASGKNDDDWQYRNLNVYLKVYDNDDPDITGVAPMAFGEYESGDTVYVTVVYDEVIDSVSSVSLKSFSALPVSSYTYVGGAGTNALCFKGTATKDFEVTTATNNTLYNLIPTVSGTVEDICGNY